MKIPEWFSQAVIYSLDVKSFYDGDGDGRGDFQGLTDRLEYLRDLGVDCIWLAPIFCSEGLDDGYDISDYGQINPLLGTMGDFELLVRKARSLGLRIVLDLVINHSSVYHPWFQQALEGPDSEYYDYYIWSKDRPADAEGHELFPNMEESHWQYQPELDAYYFHTFYRHQADLNIRHPRVQQEILAIIEFWMEKGISGFRIDAVAHLLQDKGDAHFESDPFELLNVWRSAVTAHDEDAVLFGEADVAPDRLKDFMSEGRLCALLNFYVNNYTFLALAREKAAPMTQALGRLPLKRGELYLTFLRNHDELDLGQLQESERQEIYQEFAPEEDMQIYGRGIRRRWPPMAGPDPDRIRMAMSLLLTLPGTPVIRYGEEIGMGDDLNLPERRSVRTAMQWSADLNAGFTSLPPQAMAYPLIRTGEYSYKNVNVADQQQDADSLWHVVRDLIQVRRRWINYFSQGRFRYLEADREEVLCYTYQYHSGILILLHNLSGDPLKTSIPIPLLAGRLSTLIPAVEAKLSTLVKRGRLEVRLDRYAYTWLELSLRTDEQGKENVD